MALNTEQCESWPPAKCTRRYGSTKARSYRTVGCIFVIGGAFSGGCQLHAPASHNDPTELTVHDLLQRCRSAYERSSALHARGLMRDYRREPHRVLPIRWDLVRPDRCRLQVAEDAVIVMGDRWWLYRRDEGWSGDQRHFTNTPIETAAYLLTDGVPFLTPQLMLSPGRVLGTAESAGNDRWSLEGMDWHADRPCYRLGRAARGTLGGKQLRLWIDQDSFVIRGWTIGAADDDPLSVIVGCIYYVVSFDEPTPPGLFKLSTPQPISMPAARPPN